MRRIRESLKASPDLPPMGGEGKVIEADETYVGGKAKNRAFREPAPNQAVFTLIERDGRARVSRRHGQFEDLAPDHRR